MKIDTTVHYLLLLSYLLIALSYMPGAPTASNMDVYLEKNI